MTDEQYDHLKTYFNKCEYCDVNMLCADYCYECPDCGLRKEIDGSVKDCDDEATSGLRRYNNNGQSFLFNPEYTKIQQKNILNQLLNLYSAYIEINPKTLISKDIIYSVGKTYNNIQRIIVDEENQKKFVRRGNIKDEVLGALIKYECIKNGQIVKLKEICGFMELKSGGISRGENILRNLYVENKIDIPMDEDLYDIYIRRYLKGVKIYNLRYEGFVKDIILVCIKRRIGTNSIVTSKVAGVIWLLILHERIPITFKEMEAATKNIRKNTWNRYTKIIQKNILQFMDIFKRWNIDHGITGGFLVKKSDLEQNNINYKLAANYKNEFLNINK